MLRSVKVALFAASCLSIAACVPAAAPQGTEAPPTATSPNATAPYKAVGTEPFWALTIDGDTAVFQPMEGASTVAQNITARPSFNGWRYTSDIVSVDVTFTQCSDGMSDIVYKDTVTVLVGTQEFRGCGGGAVTPGAALANSQWQIVSVNGRDVYNPMGRGPLLVRFGQDRLSAATGCNGMGGQFLSGEGWLYTPMLISTMMGCDPRLMAQEQAIGAALSGHQIIRSGPEGAMILGGEGGQIALVRAGDCPDCGEMDGNEPTPALALSGAWDIRQIGAASVQSDRPYRLQFADGRMSGYAGCNGFSGSYAVTAQTLTFGSIGATRMACMDQGGQDERRVFDILRTPLSYQVLSHDSVIIANASGGILLSRAE